MDINNLKTLPSVLFTLISILIAIIILGFIVSYFPKIINNIRISKYKRGKKENFKKFTTKRCFDDKNPDHIYLVDNNAKIFYRITDSYTLNKLGYPRPSRNKEDSNEFFKISDSLNSKREIKYYNLRDEFLSILKMHIKSKK